MEKNENLGLNIDPSSVIAQNEQETAKKEDKRKTVFNSKNYLDARLAPGEKTKTITIRLLPFSQNDGGSPFFKVFGHSVRVNKEVSQSGWKTFICPKANKMEDKCPFYETSIKAKELRLQSNTEVKKKEYGDIEFANKVKDMWIIRCIDRAHEDEGVKFWRFTHVSTGKGIYDAIYNLFQTRYNEGLNIFDVNNGKDLIITISTDSRGKFVYQVTDKGIQTPLSPDFETAKKWIEDEKKWTDVYAVKPYSYLSVIVEGGIPVWSSADNKFVDKEQLEKTQEEEKKAEIKENLTPQTDFSKFAGSIKAPEHEVINDIEKDLPF